MSLPHLFGSSEEHRASRGAETAEGAPAPGEGLCLEEACGLKLGSHVEVFPVRHG
ncbi:hypothetical protein ACMHYB_31035 [Sorangium sp. So ce1128]